MPGKSKKGGGLESSPVYKKQGYGEGVSPFKLRSGNTTPFKQMGSSPIKQGIEHIDPLDLGLIDEAKQVKKSTVVKHGKYHHSKNPGKYNVVKKELSKPVAKDIVKQPGKYHHSKTMNIKTNIAKNIAPKPKVPKKVVAKKVLGKAASRLIPGAGWALAGHDVYKISEKMRGGHSFKEALKSHYLGIEK